QPLAGADITLEEPLASRPRVGFSMIGLTDRIQDGREILRELGMPLVPVDDVPEPRVLEQHDANALRGGLLGKDRTLAHGRSATCGATVPANALLSVSTSCGRLLACR